MHFALTGNARRQDGRLIVSATLYETADDRTYGRSSSIVRMAPMHGTASSKDIYSNFDQATIDAEVARAMREHPDNLDKRDLMLAALATSLAAASKAELSGEDRADGAGAGPRSRLRLGATVQDARMHADLVLNGFSSDPDADLARATKAVDRALLLAPNDV